MIMETHVPSSAGRAQDCNCKALIRNLEARGIRVLNREHR
jgi:hypothetical protein